MDIQSLLLQWQSIGVFDYLLPFLLIFALVFGIMQKTSLLGGEKGIDVLVALVVALLALQFDFVPLFFREAFPRLGIGLAILFCIMVLLYLFVDSTSQKGINYGLMAVGLVISIVIISQSFQQFNWGGFGLAYDQYVGWIVGAVLVIGVIIAVSSSGPSGKPKGPGQT